MITRKEYLKLKERYDNGSHWIARDKDGQLYIYDREPLKMEDGWKNSELNSFYTYEDDRLFQYVKWEDEEPTKIDDLIRDYESHQVIVGERVKATVPQFVADWIEEVKALERSFKLEILFDTDEMPDEVFDWLDERYGDTDILAKAWLDGYEIELEKKYVIKFTSGEVLINFDTGLSGGNLGVKLTQSEIEGIDPRLMQFAEEVE